MSEWIKCSDRLPENNMNVIVYDGDDYFFANFEEIKDKRLKKRKGYFNICGDEFYVNEITHWMPSPKPPEE